MGSIKIRNTLFEMPIYIQEYCSWVFTGLLWCDNRIYMGLPLENSKCLYTYTHYYLVYTIIMYYKLH